MLPRAETSRPFPPGPIQVEFRPTHGPFLTITVSPEQWWGEACILGTDCASGGPLVHVGFLYNMAAIPGTIEYSHGADAHADCLRPENRRMPAHSHCNPAGARSSK
ncbi:hypothetical protein ACFC1T_16810 [Kitasatospora sp. NPDC056076]|uniref:hypothetical protein n=1 Tax=Kitasatospora sp. NPDC056076 TaxID=3345703 RepID=UPI0035DC706C